MKTETFTRKKGIFIFSSGSHSFITYDPKIQVTRKGDKILAIQFQAVFNEEDAETINDLALFPEIQLPFKRNTQTTLLYLYLNGNKMLCGFLEETLRKQPFMLPIEAVVYSDSPMLPLFGDIGFYELLEWDIRTPKVLTNNV